MFGRLQIPGEDDWDPVSTADEVEDTQTSARKNDDSERNDPQS